MTASKFLYISALMLLLNCSACSLFQNKPLGRRDYMHWINDPANGLCKSKVVGDIKFTLSYKPIDAIALNEIMINAVSKGGFDSIRNKYAGLQYFELTLDPATGNENILKYHTASAGDYYENLNYYSFKMKEDIRLHEGDTSLPCVLFNFDNSHDLSKHSTAVFAFEKPAGENASDKVIQYNATRLGLGFVKIEISASDIKNIPSLNLTEL